jgi:tetracycline repressor-like protein
MVVEELVNKPHHQLAGELPATTDWPLLVDVLSAPLHYRTLVSHEPLDSALHSRLIDMVLNGVGSATSADPPARPRAKHIE